jgi:aldehyde dehydrogenase family 7 protein A1
MTHLGSNSMNLRHITSSEATKHGELLVELGLDPEISSGVFYAGKWHKGEGEVVESINPTTHLPLGRVSTASLNQTHEAIMAAKLAQEQWRKLPAPARGAVVRKVGLALEEKKDSLANLISLEVGKVKLEALQDVENAIAHSGYCLGLGSSMNGSILPSSTPHQLLLENYHPLGVVASITSFNSVLTSFFTDAATAWTCGNSVVFKPATSASLTAIALTKVIADAITDANVSPNLSSILSLVSGGPQMGEEICKSRSVNLVSFTGSTEVGRRINLWVAERFGKVMFQLAGNNAIIVMDDANLNLALRSIVFSATASSAQRCTSTRRLFVQQGIYDVFFEHLIHA